MICRGVRIVLSVRGPADDVFRRIADDSCRRRFDTAVALRGFRSMRKVLYLRRLMPEVVALNLRHHSLQEMMPESLELKHHHIDAIRFRNSCHLRRSSAACFSLLSFWRSILCFLWQPSEHVIFFRPVTSDLGVKWCRQIGQIILMLVVESGAVSGWSVLRERCFGRFRFFLPAWSNLR